MLAYYFHGR